MKNNKRRRQCSGCGELFRSDPRCCSQQKYCGKPACRAASKKASQQRWLQKPENREYFRGPQHVTRVQAWRGAHPDYARREPDKRKALQEKISSQPLERSRKSADLVLRPLQDSTGRQTSEAKGANGQLQASALQDPM